MLVLSTTAEQEKRRWTILSIIHTVARAVVNPKFPDTTAHCVRITKIAETYASKADTDTSAGLGIT
jgi:hypothetical protein